MKNLKDVITESIDKPTLYEIQSIIIKSWDANNPGCDSLGRKINVGDVVLINSNLIFDVCTVTDVKGHMLDLIGASGYERRMASSECLLIPEKKLKDFLKIIK